MPVTPFHLGPGLFFGIIFLKYLDLVCFLVGNVIVDIEPFFVVLYEGITNKLSSYPYHGFLHTIIGAFLISLLSTFILKKFQQEKNNILLKISQFRIMKDYSKWNLKELNIEKILLQNSSFKKIFLSVFLGALFHIFFDAFTHRDVFPFWPLTHFNPLLGLNSYIGNMIVCIILGILGLILLINYLRRKS